MEFSAFISYRRGKNHKDMERNASKFKEILLERLCRKDLYHKVYLDVEDKDKGVETSLAPKLCKSSFLIVLYHRPYCQYEDHETPWCLRELVAFEERARSRESVLRNNGIQNVNMIIPVLIEEESIKPDCFNNLFHYKIDLAPARPFSKKENIDTIQAIVSYIHDRIEIIKQSNINDLFIDCDNVQSLVDAAHPTILELKNRFRNTHRAKPKF